MRSWLLSAVFLLSLAHPALGSPVALRSLSGKPNQSSTLRFTAQGANAAEALHNLTALAARTGSNASSQRNWITRTTQVIVRGTNTPGLTSWKDSTRYTR